MLSVDFEGVDADLQLHRDFLLYLSGLPARKQWELRGFTGHENKGSRRQEVEQQALNDLTKDRDRLNDILSNPLQEIADIYNTLRTTDQPAVDSVLPDKKFIFVVGHMRSGGTYLLKELLKIHGRSLEDLNLGLIQDSCPSYPRLRLWRQDEESRLQLFFELAQFLYWVREEFKEAEVVVKKRIAFAHAMPVLDHLFGDRATHLVTVRHPEESGDSFADLEGISKRGSQFNHNGWENTAFQFFDLSEEDWDDLNFYEQFLYHWASYYYDMVRDGEVSGEFIPLVFGGQLENHLEDYRERQGSDVSIEQFNATSRQRNRSLPESILKGTLDFLEEEWSRIGLTFPEL